MSLTDETGPATPTQIMWGAFAVFLGVLLLIAVVVFSSVAERKTFASYKELVGKCVSMPPYENVMITGVNREREGRIRTYRFLLEMTDRNGDVSVSSDPVAPYLEKEVIACRNVHPSAT